jgi:hypothetical protein
VSEGSCAIVHSLCTVSVLWVLSVNHFVHQLNVTTHSTVHHTDAPTSLQYITSNPGAVASLSQNGSAHQPKGLNFQTYKLHALTDYPTHIRVFGTTDSYSMHLVSTSLLRSISLIPMVDLGRAGT